MKMLNRANSSQIQNNKKQQEAKSESEKRIITRAVEISLSLVEELKGS
ncbi:MAG: hypothetical protein H8D47_04085 [Planctomycetes bacterium]|nr:hypothetical protein [Planctomycetota bacterium]MBL7107301.1 hypothetical protein [Phycisphaerae bacterium]